MKFLRDTFRFFLRQPKWGFFFAALLVLLTLLYFRSEKSEWKNRPHEALQKFQQAENRLKEEIQATGGVGNFLKERPSLLWAFRILSVLLVGIVLAGLALDLRWLTNRQWRSRIQGSNAPPEERTWGLEALFKTILLFMVGSLGLSLLLALVKFFFSNRTDSNFFILFHTTLSDLWCVALVVYFIRRFGGSWRDLGFKGVRIWKDFWTGVVGYVAVIPLFLLTLLVLVVVIQIFGVEPPPHPLVEIFLEEERSPVLIGYSIFLACVVGPFFEEIFFRGFCYPAFKKRWGTGWALVLSAAFFSAIHQNLFAFLPVFVLGLCLGYLYEKRGNLVPSIALHIVHNSVFILYFFLAKQVLTQ